MTFSKEAVMDATLSILGSGMSEEDIAELTSRLRLDINQETDLTARLPEERGGAGTRGDAVTIGAIVLAAPGGTAQEGRQGGLLACAG